MPFTYWSLFFLLFISFHTSEAQNLVPNPSFEQLRNLPLSPPSQRSTSTFRYEPNSGFKPYKKNMKYWFAGTKTTPDLRIITKSNFAACQRRYKDCNLPRTGSNAVGIITAMQNEYTKMYREYIQVKLKDTLRVGEPTFVEFWVVRDRSAKLVSNNIGAYFSQKSVFKETEEALELIPQITADSIINLEVQQWVKIEGHFISEKPFLFLTIGNFHNNEDTEVALFKDHQLSPYVPPYAYYLIDDVRVWQEGENEEEEELVFEDQAIIENEPIRLNNIFFQLDRSTLEPASYEELNKLLSFLEKYPDLKISIHGHTDNQATEAYNLKLSEARAKAVYDFLIAHKVRPERLDYKGFGEGHPVQTNDTQEGRQENRRVEFVVRRE